MTRRFDMAAAIVLLLAAFAYRALWGLDLAVSDSRPMSGPEEWFFSPTGESPRLILVVAAALLFVRRQRLADALDASRPFLVGAVLFALAAAIHFWSLSSSAYDLLIPSLSLLLISGAWFVGGPGAARVLLRPAVFLFLALPVPSVLINTIVFPLQLATAQLTVWVVNAVGLEAMQRADLIFSGERVFQVIEACSGLRSTVTLIMSALLYTELFRRPRRHELMLILAAPVIGLFVNQLRVLALVLNPFSEYDVVHEAQGIVMIVLGVLLLAAFDALLQRWLPAPARPSRPSAARRTGTVAPPVWRVVALTSGVLGLGIASVVVPPWQPAKSEQASIHILPGRIGDWRFSSLQYDAQYMGNVSFSDQILRRYRRGDDEVDVFVGVDDRQDRRSLRSGKTKLLRPGRSIWRTAALPLPPDALDATLLRIGGIGGAELAVHWYRGLDSLWREALRAAWALDRWPGEPPVRVMVVRLGTRVDPSPDGEAAARRRLDEFLLELRPILELLELPQEEALRRLQERAA